MKYTPLKKANLVNWLKHINNNTYYAYFYAEIRGFHSFIGEACITNLNIKTNLENKILN